MPGSRVQERQLSDEELKVLRRMIAEYRYEQGRNAFVSRFYSRGRLVAVALSGLAMLVLQVAAVYYSVRGHTVIVEKVKVKP